MGSIVIQGATVFTCLLCSINHGDYILWLLPYYLSVMMEGWRYHLKRLKPQHVIDRAGEVNVSDAALNHDQAQEFVVQLLLQQVNSEGSNR